MLTMVGRREEGSEACMHLSLWELGGSRTKMHNRMKSPEAVTGQAELEVIVRSTRWLMDALEAARRVDAADWMIGAGAVRTAVWDRLHGYQAPTPVADVDLIFFDADDLSEQRERAVQARLSPALARVPWAVKNQASVHLWDPKRVGFAWAPL